MISKGFIKSSFIYSFIGALPLASSFILLPFYTYYLNPNDFGMLAIYIIFTSLFQIFINFALDNFIPIIHANHGNDDKLQKEYISTAASLLIIVGLAFVALFTLTGNGLFYLLEHYVYHDKVVNFSFFPWGFFCVLTAFFNSVFKSYTNLLINQQRPMRFFWCNITNFFLTISISIAGIYLYPNTLIGPMYGRLLSGAGIFLMALYFFWHEYGFKLYKKHYREIWQFCYPLMLYFLLNWVLSSIYPYILLFYSDATMVGIFDFAVKCTLMLEFFQNGLAAAIGPKIMKIWRDEKVAENTPEVNRYYNGLTLITLLVLPVFLLLIPWLVKLVIFKEIYYLAFMLLPVLCLGFISRTFMMMFSQPALFFKKTRVFPKVFGITALIQIGLSLIMIKYFGILGAAITYSVVKFLQVFLFYLESRKIYTFRFSKIKQVWLPLLYILLLALPFPFMNDANRIWIQLLQLLCIFSASYFVFRKEILFTLRKYKEVFQRPWRILARFSNDK